MTLRILSRIYAGIARHTVHQLATNLELPLQIQARDSSARYIQAMMGQAQRFTDRDDLLRNAVHRVSAVSGCVCEFGVYAGHSLRLLAKAAPDRRVHGFDSFQGLPAKWRPGFDKGAFRTAVPNFPQKNISLHVGWFEDVLPSFVETLKEPIALLHIDCDLYSSTRCVLDRVAGHLAEHAVIVFDEYFNYPGWQQHEHKALLEALDSGRLHAQYLAFNVRGEQVMVQSVASRHDGIDPEAAAAACA